MARFSGDDDEILIEEVQKYNCIFDYEDNNYKNFVIKESAWKKVAVSVGRDVDDCKKRWKSIKDTYLRNMKKLKLRTGSASFDKPVKWNLYERLRFLDKVKQERCSKNTLEKLSERQLETAGGDVATEESTLEDPYVTEDSESSTRETPSLQIRQQKSAVPENDNLSSSSRSRCSTPLSISKDKKSAHKLSRDAFYRGFEERAQKRMVLLKDLQNKKRLQPEEDDVDFFMKSISLTVKKFPSELINEAKLKILTLVNELQEKAKLSSPHSSLGIASTEVYPNHSSHHKNAPSTGHESNINTITSVSKNSQLATSAFQSDTSQLCNTSLNTYSEQLSSTGPPSGPIFPTSFQQNDASVFHSYQAHQQNASFTLSNSHQTSDENIDTFASYQQLN